MGIKIRVGNLKKQVDKAVKNLEKKTRKELIAKLREETPVDTGEARDGWREEGDSIVNDVEHIKNLNDGSSQQAPSHFIEKTLLSHRGVKPNGIIVTDK